MTSRPTTPASSSSAAARSMWDPTSHRFSSIGLRTSATGVSSVRTSYTERSSRPGSTPRCNVAWACGSRSRIVTRRWAAASAGAQVDRGGGLPDAPFLIQDRNSTHCRLAPVRKKICRETSRKSRRAQCGHRIGKPTCLMDPAFTLVGRAQGHGAAAHRYRGRIIRLPLKCS